MPQVVQRWNFPSRHGRDSGFTIVELLIVIIVIAILALIVITTYNGVQQKAANAKTISAVEAWAKALGLYNADNGSWPTTYNSCLGEGYPFGYDGDNPTNQCGASADPSTFIERPHLSPPCVLTSETARSQRLTCRSLVNQGPGIVERLMSRAEVAAVCISPIHLLGTTTCPSLGGTKAYSQLTRTGGVLCRANLAPAP
jgi:prepilin-type N-terminal cleavage/methylation domain-containing protein